ncbi:hypothetical protein DH2020_004126 [Rehmannia glutinosa]|uniref:CST complex subunit CTC1 n=1 Tax=Rehmannia glutinosa TaxID=99300 RepID=A0ABR0XNT0_REHGL
MEEEKTIVLTISDLVQRARPLTAASSLVPSRPISILKTHKNPDDYHRQKHSFRICQDPNAKTLKPLNQPTLLTGTLTLPSFSVRDSPIKCNCFQFSNDSATICCDVLDFDSKMIDRKIQIRAWNFFPLKCGSRGVNSGFLEIISWDFFEACGENVCYLSDFSSFCLTLGACDAKDGSKTSGLIFGVIELISPVTIVPCATGETGSRNVSGFLVNVLVCQCKFCSSKFLVSELKDLTEENVKYHCFSKKVIVYFCGLTSLWYPVVSRFIGSIVLLTGLKRKLVFISNEESQLMHVTTDEVSLHIAKLFKGRGLIHDTHIRGKGECGSYTGVITGFYMQGMVVELDEDVVLLLTDQHLTVPHSVRVGAIVTLKNVHFVDPKFRWGKMLILGACCITSVYVESFSPLETGCHLKLHSQSLLQKFIDSLSFAARLWALLVVSCFRKKFAGILSEKEILGSKHQGVLLEFCKHNLCCGAKEAHYGHLRLVLPIANLINYCEASWKNILDDQENFSDFLGCTTSRKPLSCGGRSYMQSIIRVLRTEEICVIVLGTLKMSSSSGRLQLVDATGGVDIMLDLPATWDFDRIFEVAKDFRLIMEGMPPKLVDLDSTIYRPLSCRSIFSNVLPLTRMKISTYLYHCKTDEDSRSRSLFFDWEGNSQELDSGKFHLLMLTHKFPVQKKFRKDLGKRSNMFAQAIVLPLDLLVAGKYGDAVMNTVTSGHLMDSLEIFTRHEKHHKRSKIEQTSVEASAYGLNDGGNGLSGQFSASCSSYRNSCTEHTCVSNHPLELSCLIASKGVNCYCMGVLHCTNENAKISCGCKLPRKKVLLEFGPDNFCKYEVLKIGRCYLVKHQEDDMLCSIKENYQVSRAKVYISSETHIRSLAFSSIESLQSSDVSDVFPFHNSQISSDEVISSGNGIDSKIYSDVSVFVPYSALNLLENVTKIWDGSPFEEEPDVHDHVGPVINASMQSSRTSCSDYPLPEGNLITLRGLVVALHDCSGDAFPAQPKPIIGEGYLPMFLEGNGGVCVHVLVDNRTVRIFCDLSKQTYPVGLGRDAYATFHRILVLSGQNKYMMMPVSFITIDDTSLMNGNLAYESNYAYGTVGLISVPTPNAIATTTLISDALQLSEPKPMQIRCRVVAVYILVVEKARTTAVFQSSEPSIPSTFRIPFAGFVMDDGSSSCCVWGDSERAAAFLGIEPKEYLLKDSAETFGRSKASKGQPYRSNISHLNQILEKHGRVVTIGGSLMDPKASSWLEEHLTELDVAVPPLLNIWATSVSHTDMLAEARDIIQELNIITADI